MRACIHGQTARSVRLKWLTRGSGLPPLEQKQDHEERRPEQNLTDAVRAESLKRKA